MTSLKHVKCKGCGKDKVFHAIVTGKVHWCRCLKCGFHTSSYLTKEKAITACENGEHYISENGNKMME